MREERLIAQARLAVQAQSYAADLKARGRLQWLAFPSCIARATSPTSSTSAARRITSGQSGSSAENLAAELSQVAGIALAWGLALAAAPGDGDG